MSIIQYSIKKEAIVGSLLTSPLDSNKVYELATWYRVVEENRKIIKMERVKGKNSVSYRCTAFDIGAMIELIFENQSEDELKFYGPVKFDPYLTKQLEANISNNCWFSVNIHAKVNQIVRAKVRIVISEEGMLELHTQIKKQQTSFKVPVKENWRMYEEIFSIDGTKLTEVCLKNTEELSNFQNNQSVLSTLLKEKKYVLLSFLNVVQRNIFLAEIIVKSKDRKLITNRYSELKSISHSESKNCLDNQVEGLFSSNISQKKRKDSDVSQKVINDFKEVVFTPTENTIQLNRSHEFLLFDEFLNPEHKKQHIAEKLSDIAEEEADNLQKTSLPHQNTGGKEEKLRYTKKISAFSKKVVSHQLPTMTEMFNSYKTLVKQNEKLKKQNKILKTKLKRNTKTTGQIKYQLPQFFRNLSKSDKPISQRVVTSKFSEYNLPKNMNTRSNRRINCRTQTPNSYQGRRRGDSPDLRNFFKESRKKQFVTTSTKTVKRFFTKQDSCHTK